ncbi:VWA domain-containing protein [uncultured Fusobacterium sp.]|uniref:VWA domain-containing protein n=1 Tax=uncultured Fusobacterium sp. TaxID=159267 RepID=UPI0025DD6D04|nr:VWA domain-containing protein [uncultured Fusobacterium sp.]
MEKYSIGIIADRSGSVIMEKKMIEDSIELMAEALDRNYPQNIKKEIIVTCIGEEDILLPQQVEKIIMKKKLNEDNLLESENIFKLFERISKNEGVKKIFLFSDGYFKREDWDKFFSKLKEDENLDAIERIAIAVGEGVNKRILKEFSSREKVFQYKDIFDLV